MACTLAIEPISNRDKMPQFIPPVQPSPATVAPTTVEVAQTSLKSPSDRGIAFPELEIIPQEEQFSLGEVSPPLPENFVPEFAFPTLLDFSVNPSVDFSFSSSLSLASPSVKPIPLRTPLLENLEKDLQQFRLASKPQPEGWDDVLETVEREHQHRQTTPEVIETPMDLTSPSMLTPEIPPLPTSDETASVISKETLPAPIDATLFDRAEAIAIAETSPPERFEPEELTNSASLGQPMSLGYLPQIEIVNSTFHFPAPDSLTDEAIVFTADLPSFAATNTTSDRSAIRLHWSGEEMDGLQNEKLTNIIVQERGGEVREFDLEAPASPENDNEINDNPDSETSPPASEEPEPEPRTSTPPTGLLEINADRQEYDENQKVAYAEGDVEVRFAQSVVTADRVRINLPNRFMRAEGNVALKRGDQVLRGEIFEYQLVQDTGTMQQAWGEIYQPSTARDFNPFSVTSAIPNDIIPDRPLSDRLIQQQPIQDIRQAEGLDFTLGTSVSSAGLPFPSSGTRGDVKQLRFNADYVEFDSDGWKATNVRFTNDPFSPPELEIRADTAEFNRLNPLQDEILTTNSRVVFDQGFSLPIFQDRILLDRTPDRDGLFSIGIDDQDRGGLFIERGFGIIQTPHLRWSVSPQYLLQRAALEEGFFSPKSFGLRTDLTADFDRRTQLKIFGSLSSLDLSQIEDNLRGNISLEHRIGDLGRPHLLTGEFNYRDRLFNGSLGFQTVQTSYGAVLTSPQLVLGDTNINLRYQAGIQVIEADTDRADLLAADRENNRITLVRYQGAANLEYNLNLWQGKTLPATPEEGMRYTPVPLRPFVQLNTAVTAVSGLYSNGDTQQSIQGTIGLQGQFGHFSDDFFDYTGWRIAYSQAAIANLSPFLFDRIADRRVLSYGVTQQIYGPFRIGFQSSLNLDTGREISTDYILEYSRRTYTIELRYNPVFELGAIRIRIGDFTWSGYSEPFGGSGVRPVVQGLTR
ncbi:DUF3769 domain-containing protein [Spirulina sp. 06S082]|uniref:DUF3769 domain-containing protein n=1 Tax=Spirulina sp. 06S082 TaxID=3110248 RepID=UPI002B204907|nr:DUF3769 domain-containing protein [Spirulina sp. 06S082]MEA5469365.1 DUF3769 domain-containing protein [Spirulina sp. 06S082]